MVDRSTLILGGLIAFVLLVVSPIGTPVYLGYATSDSMAPTIGTNDGYLLVPTSGVEEGDIVMFRSLDREDYVTHRVVGTTEDGYLTKGDANDRTDQAAGMDSVDASAVVGEVPTVAGRPVVVPWAGYVIEFLQTNRLPALVLLAVAGIVLAVRDRRNQSVDREILRVGDVVGPVLVGAGILGVAVILLAGSTHLFSYAVVGEPTASPQAVQVGETVTWDVTVSRSTGELTTVIVTADGATIEHRVKTPEGLQLTLSIPPAEHIGSQTVRVRAAPYPAILPRAILVPLHGVSPVLAAAATVGAVLGPLYVLYVLFLDAEQPLRRIGSRRLSSRGGGN